VGREEKRREGQEVGRKGSKKEKGTQFLNITCINHCIKQRLLSRVFVITSNSNLVPLLS
jgi:hypothetical protein